MNKENLDELVNEVVDEVYMKKSKGGNYPWGAKGELEEKKATDPQVEQKIQEIVNKINNGPIHIKEGYNHPFLRPRLETLYAKRSNQAIINEEVIIPFHIPEKIRDQVVEEISNRSFACDKPINVYHDEYDKTGVLEERKVGKVNTYKFIEFSPVQGNITATIQGKINW